MLECRHRHFDIELKSTSLDVRIADESLTFELRWKRIEKDGRLLALKAEHDSLAQIRDALESQGVHVGLRWLRANLEQQLSRESSVTTVHLQF